MGHERPDTLVVWTILAAFAGSVTSLALMQWQRMTPKEIAFTIFVGYAFAIYGAPYIVFDLLGWGPETPRFAKSVVYFGGIFGNALIPLLLRKLKSFFKLDEPEKPV